MKRSSTRFGTIASTMVFTLPAALVVLNFSSGEKKLDEQITRDYTVQDAQYQRAFGVLLGPLILEGNRLLMRLRPGASICRVLTSCPMNLLWVLWWALWWPR